MIQLKITKSQARTFILAYQKLLHPRMLQGKIGILDYVKDVGCIQFDPLNVINTNPNLVLQARVENYKPVLLDQLLYQDRLLLDGWDKQMSIYRIEDRPFFSRRRQRSIERHSHESSEIYPLLPAVRAFIAENGPITSSDLKLDHKVDWSWAPTRAGRAVLEGMFHCGELVVHSKKGARKAFDLAETVLPTAIFHQADPNESEEDYFEWAIKRRIGSIGLLWNRASDAWLGIQGLKSNDRKMAFANLERKGKIIPVEVEDVPYPFYLRKEQLKLFKDILNASISEKHASFIAPLDNVMWDRKLISALFQFEYTWEVYIPFAKRKFGYYVLPILCGDRFVGRFEPRFNKKTSSLEIVNWWWEGDLDLEELANPLTEALRQFMSFLGAQRIEFNKESQTRENLLWIERNIVL